MRCYPTFLYRVPRTLESDSIPYRIEALRVYLEEKLTAEVFIDIYKKMISEEDVTVHNTYVPLT